MYGGGGGGLGEIIPVEDLYMYTDQSDHTPLIKIAITRILFSNALSLANVPNTTTFTSVDAWPTEFRAVHVYVPESEYVIADDSNKLPFVGSMLC